MSAQKSILYHVPLFCSTRPLRVVYALNLTDKIEVRTVDSAFLKTPEYLKINPNGCVPALVEPDGTVLLESGAISLYLVEKYGDKQKWLGDEKLRPKLFQWLFFGPATLFALISAGFTEHFTPPDKKDAEKAAKLKQKFQSSLSNLENALSESDWILGTPHPTLVDITVSYELYSGVFLGWVEEATHPKVKAWVDRITAFDWFQKSLPSH